MTFCGFENFSGRPAKYGHPQNFLRYCQFGRFFDLDPMGRCIKTRYLVKKLFKVIFYDRKIGFCEALFGGFKTVKFEGEILEKRSEGGSLAL